MLLTQQSIGNNIIADPSLDNSSTSGTNLMPLNDNTAPPFKAVYRWGQGGCVSGKYDAYGPWLNRTNIWAEDFLPTNAWDQVEGQQWDLGTWQWWIKKNPGRHLILTPPMLAGGWDGKGPSTGPAAHVPVSLEEGAKGTYNIYYQHLAKNLVKYGLVDVTFLRIGHEFNGSWYSWRVSNAKQAEAYAAYFKQIVTTMRAVPGAENLKFVWNPAMMPWWPYDPEKAWPGDDVVDYIGVDVYDQSWSPNNYPIPAGASDADKLARRKRVWDNETNSEQAKGLPYWVKFAAKHGNKPLCIPEWGACIRQDKHGGGDSAFFIEQMYKFIYKPANNVYFECYFDVSAGDGDHRLVPETDKNKPPQETKLPEAAAKYKELFSLPAGGQAAANSVTGDSATNTPTP